MSFLSALLGGLGSSVSLPKSPHPLRGWTNLGLFEIHGVNPKTKRSNKKMHECLSETDARSWAISQGLVEPIQVSEVEQRRVTDGQKSALRKRGIQANLAELSIVDASALLWRKADGDSRKINQREWAAACRAGYPVSALCGPTFYRFIMSTGDWRFRDFDGDEEESDGE